MKQWLARLFVVAGIGVVAWFLMTRVRAHRLSSIEKAFMEVRTLKEGLYRSGKRDAIVRPVSPDLIEHLRNEGIDMYAAPVGQSGYRVIMHVGRMTVWYSDVISWDAVRSAPKAPAVPE